ncbi:MAG TPA: hypothetical protein VMD91_18960 [Candidatus Sulfotelmatobacter sp.]|nr:hypothetical protein [Candidatus Sulfotelmatobacter sp.]
MKVATGVPPRTERPRAAVMVLKPAVPVRQPAPAAEWGPLPVIWDDDAPIASYKGRFIDVRA